MNKLIHNGHIIVDKLVTAKHTIVGEDLARSILKATTDEIVLPKRKYVDYLVMCTKDQNISVTEMSKLILDRCHHCSWVVSLKALLITHEIMNYGNERFFQYMASDSQALNLDAFSDRSDTTSLQMSKHVRSYANYINIKAVSFRIVGYDFCKVKRGGKEAFFKTLDTKKLFTNLIQLHSQLDSLLAFKPELSELMNKVVVQAFKVAFKDLVRLVACLNDATANLLENFAKLTRKDCQQSLSLYTHFPEYLKQVSKFYNIAQHLNFDASQMPSLDQVPSSLHEQMEEHIKGLEGGSNTSSCHFTPLPKPVSKGTSARRLSMPTSSFMPSQTSLQRQESPTAITTAPVVPISFSPFGNNFGDIVSYKEKEKILAEEERILQMFRDKKQQEEKSTKNTETTHKTADNNLEDFFASLDLSQTTDNNCTSSISMPANQASNKLSTSLPQGLTKLDCMLEPTRLHNHPPTSPSSPSTPVLLDFSKVSLPPSNFMPPNYSGMPYNQMNPMAPTQISSAALFPSTQPFNNQLRMLQQEQLRQEQQKQFLQQPNKNPFF